MKNVKRLMAFAVALAMVVSAAPVGGETVSYAKKQTAVKTASKKAKTTKLTMKKNMTLTDKTVGQLKKVLASKKVKKITLNLKKTKTLSIKKGDFSLKKLVVNAPNTTITNNATFDTVEITALAPNTWYERGRANSFLITTDTPIHFVVDSSRRVAGISFEDKKNTQKAFDNALAKNLIEVVKGGISNIVVGSTKALQVSASGKATVGNVSIEQAGATVGVLASGKSHINFIEMAESASSAKTQVGVEATDNAVIDRVTNQAGGAILNVSTNDNSKVASLVLKGEASAVLSGESKKETKVDLSAADPTKAQLTVEKKATVIETAKGQDVSGIVDNKTTEVIPTKEKKDTTESDTPSGGGKKPGSTGGSGGGSDSGSRSHAINVEVTGSTAYDTSAGGFVLDENLEECVSLPAGDQDLHNRFLNVSVTVKNVSVAPGKTAPKLYLAAMSDNWQNWYATDATAPRVTVQAAERVYSISLSFNDFYCTASTPNPKYYRMRFEGEGATLTYKITKAEISSTQEQDAVEQEQLGPEKIRNGNFSNGGQDWTAAVDDADKTISYGNGKATIVVKKASYTNLWDVQFQQTNVALYAGCTYRFTCTVRSTGPNRDYSIGLGNTDSQSHYRWYGGGDFNGTQNVNVVINVAREDNYGPLPTNTSLPLQFNLGGAGDTPTTYEISNVSLRKISGTEVEPSAAGQGEGSGAGSGEESGSGSGSGEGAGAGSGSGEGAGSGQESFGDNQVPNRTFNRNAQNAVDGWSVNGVDFQTGIATVTIDSVNNNAWENQICAYSISLEAGKTYKFSCQIKSNRERKFVVNLSENGGNYDSRGTSEQLSIGTSYSTVEAYIGANATDNNAVLQFNLGKIEGESGSYVIEVGNVSFCEVIEGGLGDNLVNNGNFSQRTETGVTNWTGNNATIIGGVATAVIADTATTEYGNQLCAYGINLVNGKTYEVSCKIKSDRARKFKFNLSENGGSYASRGGSEALDISTGYNVVTTRITATATDNEAVLQFNLGAIDGASGSYVIDVCDVSLREVIANN